MALIAELKRRSVFRVGAAYGIVAWLLVEVASEDAAKRRIDQKISQLQPRLVRQVRS